LILFVHETLEEWLAELIRFALFLFSHFGFLLSLFTLCRLQANVHVRVELASHATFFVEIFDGGDVLVEALAVVTAGSRSLRPRGAASSWNERFGWKLRQSILSVRIFGDFHDFFEIIVLNSAHEFIKIVSRIEINQFLKEIVLGIVKI